MSTTLLQPPSDSNPIQTVQLQQQARRFLKSQSGWSLPYPISLLLNPESQEKWATYENLFLACLRAGDNASAHQCLLQLTSRFGKLNERVMALTGLYAEATAKDAQALDTVMDEYETILKEDPTIFSIRKRRIALLRSTGKVHDAVLALATLLDSSPTDAEAWAELADCYLQLGLDEQAVFCLEEVLLTMPNAWNMHARLGEVLFAIAGKMEAGSEQVKTLAESLRRFGRSIELSDNHLRGFYGLKMASGRLMKALGTQEKSQLSSSDSLNDDLAPPSLEVVQKLNQLATAKLAEILRRSSAGEKGWDGYNDAELKAARELIDRDAQKIDR